MRGSKSSKQNNAKRHLHPLNSSRKRSHDTHRRDHTLSRPCNLIVIRHCETEWNAQKRLQGQTDIPLNETGHVQARALADFFKGETLHAIYASPLQRARQTAETIASHHALEVATHPNLLEGYYGQAEGLILDDYHSSFKEHIERYEQLDYQKKLRTPQIPGIETRFDIATRVESALHQFAMSHPDQTVLVVTHGGAIRALLMYLSREHEAPPFVPNGARLRFHHDGKTLQLQDLYSIQLNGEALDCAKDPGLVHHKRVNIES